MLSDLDYVIQSLEINLFFLRILKEHAFFIEASIPPKNHMLIQQARMLRETFGMLLMHAVGLAHGVIDAENDMVTQYTYDAERASSFLSGIPINTNITQAEASLGNRYAQPSVSPGLVQSVTNLNNHAIAASQQIIRYKTLVLNNVLSCSLFTTNYPLLIEHIRREAQFFVDSLMRLQNRASPDIVSEAVRQEAFWNRIMAEHAKFIRGLLDPTEEALIAAAEGFGNEFDALTKKALALTDQIAGLPEVTRESKEATTRIRDFKEQGTIGLLACRIRSIIIPLLGDHVLREANYYLNLLKRFKQAI